MSFRRLLVALTLPFAAACSKKDAEPQQAAAPATPPAAFDVARIDQARLMGSDSAKVWFIMGSDFECPFCRAFHDETWPAIERDYVKTGKIRVAFMNFPMNMKYPSMHPRSVPAAQVAMCAAAQDRFWQMHDLLFANQEKWVRAADPQPVFESLAQSLGLDMAAWKNCVSTQATRLRIESDFARMSKVGVEGTPSFVIGDSLAVVGAAPYSEFKQAIDKALARVGK